MYSAQRLITVTDDIEAMLTENQDEISEKLKFPGLWERITEALGTTKTTVIAEKLGVAPSSVSQWRHDGQRISVNNLLKIANLGNTSIDWLLTGKEKPGLASPKFTATDETGDLIVVPLLNHMGKIVRELAEKENTTPGDQAQVLIWEALKARGLVSDRLNSDEVLHFLNLGQVITDFVKIKLIGKIAAGEPIEQFDEEDYIELEVTKMMVNHPQCFALEVKGDSMIEEGVFHGDRIIVDPYGSIYNGALVVAMVNGGATLKRFHRVGSMVHLVPGNPAYETKIFHISQVEIKGTMTGLIRGRK